MNIDKIFLLIYSFLITTTGMAFFYIKTGGYHSFDQMGVIAIFLIIPIVKDKKILPTKCFIIFVGMVVGMAVGLAIGEIFC